MFFVTLQINLDKSILPVSMETFDQYKITSFICVFVTLLLKAVFLSACGGILRAFRMVLFARFYFILPQK